MSEQMAVAVANGSQTVIEHEAAQSVLALMKKYARTFEGVLPQGLTKERFAWLAVNSVRQTPALAGCTSVSFMNSVLLAANMGLEIRRNSAYLIPYGKECQLLIDYRGKIDLARRSAKIGQVTVELVRERDLFEFERTAKGTQFRHKPYIYMAHGGRIAVPDEERGEIVLGYVMTSIEGSPDPQIEIMTLDEIEKIRRRAKSGAGVDFQSFGKTIKALSLAEIRQKDAATMGFRDPYRVPWVTDYDQMARKTLVHRAANYWPQTPALALSQEVDSAEAIGSPMPQVEIIANAMIDPADDKPMVLIPEGFEAQRAAQIAVVEQKTRGGKSTKIENLRAQVNALLMSKGDAGYQILGNMGVVVEDANEVELERAVRELTNA